MSLTIGDIRRALLNGGHMPLLDTVLEKALHPPARQAIETASTALLRPLNAELAQLVEGWIDGKALPAKQCSPGVQLSLRPIIPYGRNVSTFIEETMSAFKPDAVLLDTSPVTGLGAGAFHAFSLHNMLGLPLSLKTVASEGMVLDKGSFFPGSFLETTIIKCHLDRIPLVPIGPPYRRDPSRTEQLFRQFLEGIYEEFDHTLGSPLPAGEAAKRARKLTTRMWQGGSSIINEEREYVINDCCYLASRIAELCSFFKKGNRLLIFIAIEHFCDLEPLIKTFSKGRLFWDEFYQPPLGVRRPVYYRISEENHGRLWDHAGTKGPASTLSQKRFQKALERRIARIIREPLTLQAADLFTTQIMNATRHHPAIEQGAGVRGSLALREVAQGYAWLGKGLNRSALYNASLVTLPHRIRMKPGSEQEPLSVIRELTQEVLYGLHYRPPEEQVNAAKPSPLTRENLKKALEGLTDVSLNRARGEETSLSSQDWSFAQEVMNHPLVQEALRNAHYPADSQEALRQLLEDLEGRGMLEHLTPDHYTLAEKGRADLIERLRQKLERGEISPEKLAEMLNHIKSLPTSPSGIGLNLPKEKLSQFLAELMDAQHQGRSLNTSLEDIYVHYTLGEKKGVKTDPEKLDYQKLQIMIHHLEEQGLLKVTGSRAKNYTLTSRALSRLLEELIPKSSSSTLTRHAFKKQHEIEKAEVRRYKRGDVYRDISIRHTLKEMIKQGKTLDDIGRREFRAFDKKPGAQLDIVLCVDVSASMKEQAKLRYAKLALSGLAKAALEKRDRVGIVAFSNVGNVVTPLTDDYRIIVDSVIRLRADQYTNIGNGLSHARNMLLRDKSGNNKYIILITDGQPNAAIAAAMRAEEQLGKERIREHYPLPEDALRGTQRRGVDWKAKEQLGTRHAIAEARKTRDKNIKVSVLLITHRDELGEWTARKIAQIGRGKFYCVKTVENMPLNALQMFQ